MSRADDNRNNRQGPQVVAIGLDAPNHELLLQWIAQDRLPNLNGLLQRSARVSIRSPKLFSNEHCWIPVLTGIRQDKWDHWIDHWDPGTYAYDEASLYNWEQAPLFYALGGKRRVTAFDLYAPVSSDVNGIQVAGWATDLNECFPQSAPPELFQELVARYGPDPKSDGAHEITDRLTQRKGVSYAVPNAYDADDLRRFGEALVRSAERRAEICQDLFQRDDWDLFITLFSETHTAGHILSHLSQPHPLAAPKRYGEDQLLAVYQAVDHAVGRLLQGISDDSHVVFFTIDNIVTDCLENARSLFLPEFLYRRNFPGKAALAEGARGAGLEPPRLDYQGHWKHEVWRLRTPWGDAELESPAQQEARRDPLSWCPSNWYAPLWPAMWAFAMPSVADGYIRINVQAREAQGRVAAAEYGAVCERLARDLSTLVDARTGRPMVREVVRVREDPFDPDPKKSPADLIVVWQEEHPVDAVESPLVGRIGPVPYFRSGGHQSHGSIVQNLLCVSGPGVRPGQSSETAMPEDIPATILALMDLEPPAHYDGIARVGPGGLLDAEGPV